MSGERRRINRRVWPLGVDRTVWPLVVVVAFIAVLAYIGCTANYGITTDVLRKLLGMKKVEFNVGQPSVGLGTGVPLISGTEDIERILRDNEGINQEILPWDAWDDLFCR